MRLESKRDDEGLELRPVYGCARSDMSADVPEPQPIGWAATQRQAAKLINKYLAEEMGEVERIKTADLYWSGPLAAWFPEE